MTKFIEQTTSLININEVKFIIKIDDEVDEENKFKIKFCVGEGVSIKSNFETEQERDARFEELKRMLVHECNCLSERDSKLIMDLCKNPPEPNEELKRLFKEKSVIPGY